MPSRHGILLAALLAAGCGSTPVAQERPAQEPATARKSGPTFQAEAKRVCGGLGRRLRRVQKTVPPTSPRLWTELADAWGVTIRRLRELDPPAKQRRRFRQMLAHFDQAVRAARAVPRAEGEMALPPLAVLLEAGGKGATIARSLGLLHCSAVPPEPTAAERARFNEYVLREARREFERGRRFPRLDQPAHPRRVRPRIEATPGS